MANGSAGMHCRYDGSGGKPKLPNESATRQHAFTGPALPQLAEPTYAERVRKSHVACAGCYALNAVAQASWVSVRFTDAFALDSAGRPIFLISNMAMHTHNLKADSRCSLFVAQVGVDGDPLGAARATLVGDAEAVPEGEIASARETYLARHENSRYWVEFSDFNFFRLEPVEVYYVGGFGVMGWVDARGHCCINFCTPLHIVVSKRSSPQSLVCASPNFELMQQSPPAALTPAPVCRSGSTAAAVSTNRFHGALFEVQTGGCLCWRH